MTEDADNVAVEIQNEADAIPQEESTEVQEQETKESKSKEDNFNNLRETKERLERENKELKEWSKRYAEEKDSKEKEEDYGIDDDDIVEGRYVKKIQKQLRDLENRYEKEKAQALAETLPDRLKSKFPDFDQVVTEKNIEKLKHAEPELYASIISGNNLYNKGVSAYKTLTALGIVKVDEYKEQKEQVSKNHSKPLSAQAIRGQGALSEANIFAKGLTPDLKKQLQQEMQQAAKGH